ncbi:MAG: hypothetical protein EXR27_01045 [Betaproteobacteria bacterium]|nr:hypothetical protein [Betaproteobacteria bacterium]
MPTASAAIAGFGTLELDAIFIATTGPSYALGESGDRALAARLSQAARCTVATASLAILDALRTLGCADICLVSPYPAWLTDRATAYWEGAGIRVASVVTMTEEFRAYEMQTVEVLAALARARSSAGSAVLMTGTGMTSIDAIRQSASAAGVPLLSSNLCGAWRMLDLAGELQRASRSPGCFADAAPWLASRALAQ